MGALADLRKSSSAPLSGVKPGGRRGRRPTLTFGPDRPLPVGNATTPGETTVEVSGNMPFHPRETTFLLSTRPLPARCFNSKSRASRALAAQDGHRDDPEIPT